VSRMVFVFLSGAREAFMSPQTKQVCSV